MLMGEFYGLVAVFGLLMVVWALLEWQGGARFEDHVDDALELLDDEQVIR